MIIVTSVNRPMNKAFEHQKLLLINDKQAHQYTLTYIW